MRRGSLIRRIGVVSVIATLALGVGVAQAGGGTVKTKNFSFKPRTIKVHKGDRVTWKWVKGRHTVTFKKGSYDKLVNKRHRTRSRTFRRRGTFKYVCRFHRALGMKGKVVVE